MSLQMLSTELSSPVQDIFRTMVRSELRRVDPEASGRSELSGNRWRHFRTDDIHFSDPLSWSRLRSNWGNEETLSIFMRNRERGIHSIKRNVACENVVLQEIDSCSVSIDQLRAQRPAVEPWFSTGVLPIITTPWSLLVFNHLGVLPNLYLLLGYLEREPWTRKGLETLI